MIVRQVDHIRDDRTIIAKDFFKKETDISLFVGLKVCRGPPGRHRAPSHDPILHVMHPADLADVAYSHQIWCLLLGWVHE